MIYICLHCLASQAQVASVNVAGFNAAGNNFKTLTIVKRTRQLFSNTVAGRAKKKKSHLAPLLGSKCWICGENKLAS